MKVKLLKKIRKLYLYTFIGKDKIRVISLKNGNEATTYISSFLDFIKIKHLPEKERIKRNINKFKNKHNVV